MKKKSEKILFFERDTYGNEAFFKRRFGKKVSLAKLWRNFAYKLLLKKN